MKISASARSDGGQHGSHCEHEREQRQHEDGLLIIVANGDDDHEHGRREAEQGKERGETTHETGGVTFYTFICCDT